MLLSGKKTDDVSQIKIGDQTGSTNESIADSEYADKAAVVEQPLKRIKTTSDGSYDATDVAPLHPAGNTFNSFLQSEEFTRFRSRVLEQPTKYMKFRKELERENLHIKELLSKDPSHDPLLDEIIDDIDCTWYPGGEDFYKFVQSKQFDEFCSRVVDEPANYKTFRDELEMKNPDVQMLQSEDQLCDPLLVEIITRILLEGDFYHIPLPERIKLVENSEAFKEFKEGMKDRPWDSQALEDEWRERDPFVMMLLFKDTYLYGPLTYRYNFRLTFRRKDEPEDDWSCFPCTEGERNQDGLTEAQEECIKTELPNMDRKDAIRFIKSLSRWSQMKKVA